MSRRLGNFAGGGPGPAGPGGPGRRGLGARAACASRSVPPAGRDKPLQVTFAESSSETAGPGDSGENGVRFPVTERPQRLLSVAVKTWRTRTEARPRRLSGPQVTSHGPLTSPSQPTPSRPSQTPEAAADWLSRALSTLTSSPRPRARAPSSDTAHGSPTRRPSESAAASGSPSSTECATVLHSESAAPG